MSLLPPLPAILLPYQDRILATQQQTIRLHPQTTAFVHAWQSKLGGTPYLALGAPYPKNDQGRPLFFLAQINCAELPKLASFPTHGIIQFFILDDELYGLDFEAPTKANNFRVLYYPEVLANVAQLTTDFSFLPLFDEGIPLNNPSASRALQFTLEDEFLGPPDFHFDQVFDEVFLDGLGNDKDEAFDFFYDLGSKAAGSKMGGYAFFTQEDPRPLGADYLLLLQLDSDSDLGMVWGDMGIANFFIPADDLAAMRFDRVWYNWDCS
jgi:uncharacterized protein YwqG